MAAVTKCNKYKIAIQSGAVKDMNVKQKEPFLAWSLKTDSVRPVGRHQQALVNTEGIL